MPQFLITYSPLLLIALMTVLGIAAIVSILRRATRQQEDLDLHLQDRLLYERLSDIVISSASKASPPLKPVAPSRRAEPAPAPTDKPTLPLLRLDHVSARRPLKLALEKA